MRTSGVKVDLHVHSQSSKRPSQWVLQKLNCPESFTKPKRLYEIAKGRGMDLVTITDHNTVTGALEIAHLEDTFISEEITAYFPENQCKLHVLALDISEEHHAEISRLRKNVYELVAYLNNHGICHILAHPLYDINHKLTLAYFEKTLLLFTNFELNGSRDGYQNSILKSILAGLTKTDIEHLADKHGIEPYGERPWKKNLTGGSDDHSSLNIARMYTIVPGATSKQEFFAGILEGKGVVQGNPATPLTLAHNLYGIAYQYYKSKFNLDRYVHKDVLFRFIDSALTVSDGEKHGLLAMLQDYFASRKPLRSLFSSKSPGVTAVIQEKAQSIILKNSRLRRIIRENGLHKWEKEQDWFNFVNDASEEVMKSFADATLDSLANAKLFNIFQTIGSAGSVYTLLAPYFLSFRLFTKDRQFAELCRSKCIGQDSNQDGKGCKIALFTDTLYETNGVALTLRMQLQMARKNNRDLSLLTCSPHVDMHGILNFQPIGTFELPEYPELKLYYPPFLKMLNYCYENEFTHIQSSTPGPVGLAALAIARILDLPLYGTYHTALPQYAAELTGDADMEDLMWKCMVWYYNQMDVVYVPSKATGEELIGKGIHESKIQLYPRGIDTKRFHPSKKNGFWTSTYRLPSDALKLLYVGRVSKEKNLDVLTRAFRQLEQRYPHIHLIVVGDGPYREEMQKELHDSKTLFTGYLDGENLAQAYASSDLFIFPSGTDTFGNVVLEAQSSGIPVIVTDQGGPQENLIAEKTGFIIPAMDSQAIIDTVSALIEDPHRLSRMKITARQYMENRSFEAAFLQAWELYTHRSPKGAHTHTDVMEHSFKKAS